VSLITKSRSCRAPGCIADDLIFHRRLLETGIVNAVTDHTSPSARPVGGNRTGPAGSFLDWARGDRGLEPGDLRVADGRPQARSLRMRRSTAANAWRKVFMAGA